MTYSRNKDDHLLIIPLNLFFFFFFFFLSLSLITWLRVEHPKILFKNKKKSQNILIGLAKNFEMIT